LIHWFVDALLALMFVTFSVVLAWHLFYEKREAK